MRAAVIEDGVVTNFIEVSALDVLSGLVEAEDLAVGNPWEGEVSVQAPLPPVPVVPPTVPEYIAAIQIRLDDKARERNYDSILSACTYVTSTVPKFQAEGQACVEWRDAVWAQSYALMAQVQGGEIAQPTIPELLAMLPTMEWPV